MPPIIHLRLSVSIASAAHWTPIIVYNPKRHSNSYLCHYFLVDANDCKLSTGNSEYAFHLIDASRTHAWHSNVIRHLDAETSSSLQLYHTVYRSLSGSNAKLPREMISPRQQDHTTIYLYSLLVCKRNCSIQSQGKI